MSFKEDFFTLLDGYSSSPILFLGSGFSKRYIDTESWEDLLRKFSEEIGTQFEKFRSKANGDWPKVGSYLAQEYHEQWFSNDYFSDVREAFRQEMASFSSPLKVSIAKHLLAASDRVINPELAKEIDLLKAAKIDSIVTTNYDLLTDRIFPDFKVYKSQNELIFSPLQEVGEIYKIHGCCTEPNSLVLTEEDYNVFSDQNQYLAAKLMTTFLEHPTIFIGYSIKDRNIRLILSSVLKCLDESQISQISRRLFFVEYTPDFDGSPTLEKYEIEISGTILPLTRIKAKSYLEIYAVLTQLQQKLPAAILRRIKEHIYELVMTNDPTGRINVIDYNGSKDMADMDVVLGFGIHNKEKSYETFGRMDIAADILLEEYKLDPRELCIKTLPKICKSKGWIPVCKYVEAIEDKNELDAKILAAYQRPLADWSSSNSYLYLQAQLNESHNSIEDLLKNNLPEKACVIIPLLDLRKIDVQQLKQFLIDNKELLDKPGYTSHYMKLLCLYDRLYYGPKSSP